MNNKVFLSIVVPFFNGELFIVRLLRSIESSYNIKKEEIDLEVLIIIDSLQTEIDRLRELLNNNLSLNFANKIKLFKNDLNIGVAGTRNKGLGLGKGNFVTFVDQDDSLDIQYFDALFPFFNTNTFDICLINGHYIHANSNKKVPLYFIKPSLNVKEFLLQNRILTTGLVLFRREFLIKNELSFVDADKSYKGCDDWFLYLNIINSVTFKFIFINKYIYNYYFHDSNYSNNIREAIIASMSTVKYFSEKYTGKRKELYRKTLERLNFEMLLYADNIGLMRCLKKEPLGFIYFIISRLNNLNRMVGFFYRKSIRMPFRT